MKAAISSGLNDLYTLSFRSKEDFEFFIENINNIIPQFVKYADVKYVVQFERVGRDVRQNPQNK